MGASTGDPTAAMAALGGAVVVEVWRNARRDNGTTTR